MGRIFQEVFRAIEEKTVFILCASIIFLNILRMFLLTFFTFKNSFCKIAWQLS